MEYISYKATSDFAGTSLQGYLTTTRSTIEKAFGEGTRYTAGGGDKISIDWAISFETDCGRTVKATVYAWKTEGYVPPVDELFRWNVGGHNLDALDFVYQAIERVKEL